MLSIAQRVAMAHVLHTSLDKDLFTWLSKRFKKSKGALRPDLLKRAFEVMPGWSVEEIHTSYSSMEDDFWRTPPGVRGPFFPDQSFNAEDAKTIEDFRSDLLKRATVLPKNGKPPKVTREAVGHIFMTPPTEVSREALGMGKNRWVFTVVKAWVVTPGWEITAPGGDQFIVARKMGRRLQLELIEDVSSESFWKWAYAHGLDIAAKEALERLDAQGVEKAEASAEDRKIIEQRRTFVPSIEKLFLEITKKTKDTLLESLQNWMVAMLSQMLEYYKDHPPSILAKDPYTKNPLRSLLRVDRIAHTAKKIPEADEKLQKMAKDRAEAIQGAFVHKNTMKISTIVTTKGLQLMDEPKIRHIQASDQSIEGEIAFSFKDGSSFIVRNKVVWKRSFLGTDFAQFPTTFHNVILPSGKPMSSPSEKRMIDVFAQA